MSYRVLMFWLDKDGVAQKSTQNWFDDKDKAKQFIAGFKMNPEIKLVDSVILKREKI